VRASVEIVMAHDLATMMVMAPLHSKPDVSMGVLPLECELLGSANPRLSRPSGEYQLCSGVSRAIARPPVTDLAPMMLIPQFRYKRSPSTAQGDNVHRLATEQGGAPVRPGVDNQNPQSAVCRGAPQPLGLAVQAQ
jgi:hypothetical protein